MQSRKSVSKERSFLVTPDNIARLVGAMQNEEGKIEITVQCKDGTTLYPNSIEDLLSLPNEESRDITAIEIETTSGFGQAWSIEFSKTSILPIQYRVKGDEDQVVHLSNKLERHLEAITRNQFHILATSVDLEIWVGALLPFLTPACLTAGVFGLILNAHHLHFWLGRPASMILLLLGFTLLFLAIQGKRLRSYFFPKGAFCIGDGAARYSQMSQRRNQWMWCVAIAFVVGIAASMAANMLSSH